MNLKRSAATALAFGMLIALVGCAGEPLTTRERDTMVGGGAGLAGGALVGAAVGHPGAGAAIGGLGGAAAGYAIGNHEQNERDRRYYGDY